MDAAPSWWARLRRRGAERVAAWSRRRHGSEPGEVTITRRRVYILPTGLGITFGAFLLGLMSDWLIARNIRDLGGMLDRLAQDGNAGSALDANHAKLALLKAAYAVVPNFQVFWLSDAIQQKKDIPLAYLMPSTAYGVTMIVAVMCVAVAMFQRREVG